MQTRYGTNYYREHIADVAIAAQTEALKRSQIVTAMTAPEKVLTPNQGCHRESTGPTSADPVNTNLTVQPIYRKNPLNSPIVRGFPILGPVQPPLFIVEDACKQQRTAHAELIAHEIMFMVRGALDGNINAVSDSYDQIKALVAKYGTQAKCDALKSLINEDWLDADLSAGVA